MKILLTIEEYRERIIGNVMTVASRSISDGADDFFKWKFIELLTDMCLVEEVPAFDQCNQMFMRVFELDRNGNPLKETLKSIDQAEADEFNNQKWYKEFNEDARKSWKNTYLIYPYDEMPGHDDWDHFYYTKRTLQHAFINDTNTKYYIAKEIFLRLYGHEFKYDQNYKPIK